MRQLSRWGHYSDYKYGWAHIRLHGLSHQMKHLEDLMKKESTEFLRSSPRVKQLCIFYRSG